MRQGNSTRQAKINWLLRRHSKGEDRLLSYLSCSDTGHPDERWIPMKEGLGLYQINPSGVIRELFNGTVRRAVTDINTAGYPRVRVREVNDSGRAQWRWYLIHQLVHRYFVNPDPSSSGEIDHIDGNKLNNHCSNLQHVTSNVNVQRSFIRGNHSSAKLSVPDVIDIRRRQKQGQSLEEIAASYPWVKPGTVRRVLRRETWSYVTEEMAA